MASKFNEGKGELSVEEASDEMAAPEAQPDNAAVEELAQARSATATVVAGLSLGASVVESILSGLGSVNRKVVISLANNTGLPLSAISVYFFSGTSDLGLPGSIPDKHTLGFGARKTAGPVARGTVGVLTYHIAARNQTAALMWSVPYDYNLYSNWWNFEVRSGRVAASRSLYQSLYNSNTAIKGDSNHVKRSTNGWTFEGSMGHSGTPLLSVVLS